MFFRKKEKTHVSFGPKWDELNRPKGYIIGVTPGFARFEQGEEKLSATGLGKKIMKAARLGFEFAQIDIEDVSEIYEPDVIKEVQYVKNVQGIEIGVHLPVNMDLCVARAYAWKQMHDQLKRGTIGSAQMGAKYILFHSSSEARPNLTAIAGQHMPSAQLFAFDGTNLGAFIIKESEKRVNGRKFDFKDWFMAMFMHVLVKATGAAGDPGIISYFSELAVKKGYGFKRIIEELEKRYKELVEFIAKIEAEITEEKIKKGETIVRKKIEEEIERRMEKAGIRQEYEKLQRIIYTIRMQDFDTVYTYWTRHGSEAEEYVAYHVIAKWMYIRNDPLWKEIVQIPHNEYRDPDMIVDEANRVLSSITMEKKAQVIEKINSIITAVAAKYIHGHLTTTALPEYGISKQLPTGEFVRDRNGNVVVDSILNYCKQHRMQIFIETNMPGGYGEATTGAPPGELRIIKATDHIRIVKVIDPNVLSYNIDFEHLLTNYIDPLEEAKEIRKMKWGKYIRSLHINAPKPIAGTHGPIELYSRDMFTLYKFLYELRQGEWKNSYMIWEMGSYGVRESAVVFRRFAEALEKNIPPEELDKKFFGIDENFEARQMEAIREHAFDPLEGMLMVPEEKHTFLSRTAFERGKPTEWEREKYK